MYDPEHIRIVFLREPSSAPLYRTTLWEQHAQSIRVVSPDTDIVVAPEGTTLDSADPEAFLLVICDANGLRQTLYASAAIRARCIVATLDESTQGDMTEQLRLVAQNGFAGGYIGPVFPDSRRALVNFAGRMDILAATPKTGLDRGGEQRQVVDGYCRVVVLRTTIVEYLRRVRDLLGVGWNRHALPPSAGHGEA